MKRLVLALVAMTAAAAIPTQAAQATTFNGSCTFTNASYGFSADAFSFSAGLNDGGCSGSLNDVDGGYLAVWESSGTGSFSCLGGQFGAGDGSIDFYVRDPQTQATTFVDSLDLAAGEGMTAGGQVFRRVTGTRSGDAIETGRLAAGSCGVGRYVVTFQTVNGTLTD